MKHVIYAFLFGVVFMNSMNTKAMNETKELVKHMWDLPGEVQDSVFAMAKRSKASSFLIYQEDQKNSYPYLPTTTPVKFIEIVLQDVAKDKQPEDNCITRIAMHIKKGSHKIFCESLIKDDAQHCFVGNVTGDDVIFDGINRNNKGILFVYTKQSDSFTSYHMCKTRWGIIQISWAALCGAGAPVSCTLDCTTNTFLLLKKNQDTYTGELCTVHPQRHSFDFKTQTSFQYPVEKVVSFGNNIYGMLTADGLFKTLAHDSTFNLLSVKDQKHGNLRFQHIAVNSTYANERKFRPRFAFLATPDKDNEADLYVCDLREFEKPTLMLAHTVQDADRIKYFYYSGAFLQLVYHDAQDPTVISHVEELHDNFDLLLTKVLIRQIPVLLNKQSETAASRKRKAKESSEDEPASKRTRFNTSNTKKSNT